MFLSAIYVVDLDRFRRLAAGDRLRGQYQVSKQLSMDLEGNKRRTVYMFTAISIEVIPQSIAKSVLINDDWYYAK